MLLKLYAILVTHLSGENVDFFKHTSSMTGFHRRYVADNNVCKLWAGMVRPLNVTETVL